MACGETAENGGKITIKSRHIRNGARFLLRRATKPSDDKQNKKIIIKTKIELFNLEKFIADSVTFRPKSMFEKDIKANAEKLAQELRAKKELRIHGVAEFGGRKGGDVWKLV